MSSDGVPIGSGTLAGDLGGITIWTPGQTKVMEILFDHGFQIVTQLRPRNKK